MSVLQFPRLARTREEAAAQLADLTADRGGHRTRRPAPPSCPPLTSLPPTAADTVRPILGYVVLTTPTWSDVAMLTHTGVMTRDEAEVEAARWLSSGRHVTICTVTEAMAQP